MPLTSVSAPPAGSTTQEEAARELRQLSGLVYAYGKCRTAVLEPGGDDPWFPLGETEAQLEISAAAACAGCPVIAECLEMALRLEESLARQDVVGIFGATPGHRRLQLLDARRKDARRGGEVR